jgi:double-strand break repair protein MRE11
MYYYVVFIKYCASHSYCSYHTDTLYIFLYMLDLLSVTNLVNYFGRQEEVDQIQIPPILFQKGRTKVALYGLGSLRDERLNRMWEKQKVEFLRPIDTTSTSTTKEDNNDEDVDEDLHDDHQDEGFFNIFALHQNRDLGRGAKNCVQESMIPEWMDVVVWVCTKHRRSVVFVFEAVLSKLNTLHSL